jgi:hypothetical protein
MGAVRPSRKRRSSPIVAATWPTAHQPQKYVARPLMSSSRDSALRRGGITMSEPNKTLLSQRELLPGGTVIWRRSETSANQRIEKRKRISGVSRRRVPDFLRADDRDRVPPPARDQAHERADLREAPAGGPRVRWRTARHRDNCAPKR